MLYNERMDKFQKRHLALRQQLIGARYFDALAAMEFASRFHSGTRKDLITPEFDHQICIALYALTLSDISLREEVIATIMLHDVDEDYGVGTLAIRALFSCDDKARIIGDAVDCMTKVIHGVQRDEKELFERMANDPVASIAKGCDRIHNLSSMGGVFTIEKQKKYIAEVRNLFLPMLKKARRNFPHQTAAYENIKFVLNSQITLIEAGLNYAIIGTAEEEWVNLK